MTDEELAELESVASPGAGACGGQFTANTMAMAFEMMGISPMGPSGVPAQERDKAQAAFDAGRLVMDVLRARPAPERPDHEGVARERDRRGHQLAAARPTASCTCSRSRRRPGVELDIDDFDRISERTPLLCDLSPGGKYNAIDMYHAGGTAVLAAAPEGARRSCNADAPTVARQDGRRARRRGRRGRGPAGRPAARRPAQGDRRPGDPARQHRPGGLRREARRPRAPPPRRPGARLRGRGGRDGRGHARRRSSPATSSIIRNEGPAGGPGMREMLAVTARDQRRRPRGGGRR